jgi:hypothetical protein
MHRPMLRMKYKRIYATNNNNNNNYHNYHNESKNKNI